MQPMKKIHLLTVIGWISTRCWRHKLHIWYWNSKSNVVAHFNEKWWKRNHFCKSKNILAKKYCNVSYVYWEAETNHAIFRNKNNRHLEPIIQKNFRVNFDSTPELINQRSKIWSRDWFVSLIFHRKNLCHNFL